MDPGPRVISWDDYDDKSDFQMRVDGKRLIRWLILFTDIWNDIPFMRYSTSVCAKCDAYPT